MEQLEFSINLQDLTRNSFTKMFSKLILFILVINSVVNLSHALYEDQIGKFDWRQTFVGKVKDAYFDASSNDRLIVATEENVLAALSSKTGEILWRQLFERSSRGDIKLLYVPTDSKSVVPADYSTQYSEIITVSGVNPIVIRGWNPVTGVAAYEWSYIPTTPEKAEDAFWFSHNSRLYYVTPYWSSHLEVVAPSPQGIKTYPWKVPATWLTLKNCVLAAPSFACVVGDQIQYVDLTLERTETKTKSLTGPFGGSLKALRGAESVIVVDGVVVSLKESAAYSGHVPNTASALNEPFGNDDLLVQADLINNLLEISASNRATGAVSKEIAVQLNYPDTLGTPTIYHVKCKASPKSETPACRVVLSTSDGAIVLVQQGKIKWTREESFANIVAVEMIDLPVSDAEGAIEKELNSKDGDVFGAFTRRIHSQVVQIKNLVLTVLGLGAPLSATQKAGLVRDSFGLHKVIVVVTASGKVFGLDNISGRTHWVRYLKDLTNFRNEQNMRLVVQRTAKHFPNQPQCAILGRNKQTGNGVIYQFNPITGLPITGSGFDHLDYPIKQIALLQEHDSTFLRGIMLLDGSNQVHVMPASLSKLANGVFLFTAEKATGDLTGLFVEYVDNKFVTTPTWQINLAGAGKTQQITTLALKNPIEHVHSQGRVLNDRSVLYKYINPNLVAVVTQGNDAIYKYILNVHLVDVVSGAIVFSMTHRRAKGPVHIVHSENWLVYSYYNDKVRRTEITTVELYEGKSQTNSTVWSSLNAPPLPLVERQSYIVPGTIESLKETITEKGITNKHILMALSTGAIIEMPWALLDPRRPISMPNQAREEGIIPYIPELPLPSENIINYNQSVGRIRDIYSAPSGLESTCLVFAYGLDVFVTRVSPSKTFDLLKEDFDYFLISVVLIVLTTASFVVKHLSSRKTLKQAWK